MTITVSTLTEFDSNLELVNVPNKEQTLHGITDKALFLKDNILFIRDKKFLGLIESNLSKHFDLGLIVDKSLYESDFPAELKGKFIFEAVSTNIPISICRLSQVFFEEKFGQNNNQVDGRQMGSAEVHPTALISQGAFIAESAKVGKNVKIHPGAFIGANSVIDDDCEVFANAVIYHNVKIGKRCRIHANAVIGSDGYGYNHEAGVHNKIYHMGGVHVGDDVEIGPGTCIDCGTFSPTTIGSGSKLDNLVHVAHNVQLGTGVLLCAGVAIAGSSVVGDYSVFAGMSGMADNCKIGKGCQVGGGAKIVGDWPDGSILGGHPARPLKEWLRGIATLRKLALKK